MVRQSLIRILACVFAVVWAAGAAALEAGVGRADITPPVGSPLNGYGDRMGRGAVEIHDPVWSRCLYLNDGQTGVFLVTTDLCLITPELRARVLELAPRGALGQNVILTATHTHSAQGGIAESLVFRAISGRFVPELLERTARGIAESMRLAFETRRQAVIGYGTAEQDDLSVNRRVDEGPIDPQIGVLRVNDTDLNPMAVLVNFAAHPTTVGGNDKMSVSADYCGYFYTELEKQLPGVTAMFTNGAQGNQRPAGQSSRGGWANTKAIGEALAERVTETAATIKCGDAILQVGYAEPELPLSMAHFAPRKTIVQSLEINDLAMLFVPGEACVEIGLDLRAFAKENGYGAQFTVGLSNDYAGYFVPPAYYAQNVYENNMNFFGPRIGGWFRTQFSRLMSRVEPEEPAEIPEPVVEGDEPLRRVVLKGDAYEIGVQRGKLFKDTLERRYQANIVEPVASGRMLPKDSTWETVSNYLDVSRYALVVLGIGSRPLLQGAKLDLYDELQGMADGAGLPFDAAWLVQALPAMSTQESADTFFRNSFCTMVAAVGDRAGASDVLVARNLDWPGPRGEDFEPTVFDVRPSDGRRYMQVGFPWTAGVFTGMNESGVTVCAERMESLGDPDTEGLPVEFALRDVMKTAKTAEDAAVIIQQQYGHLRGYHVLIADSDGPTAYVLELGRKPVIREPDKGYLAGADPESSHTDEAAKSRYARAAEIVEEDHVIGLPRLEEVLADQLPGETGMKSIWNADTRYSVLFEPKKRILHVSVPGENGRPGEYVSFAFEGDAS